jgi:nitrite reductase/ring-hydroxylating ferredoxin subunit
MLVDICAVEDRRRWFTVEGAGRVLAVFRDRDTADTVVVDGRCPHAGAPMEDGWLHDGAVVCPWHRYRFSPRDGRCENNARYRLPTYPTTVVNGRVIADVPFNPLGTAGYPGGSRRTRSGRPPRARAQAATQRADPDQVEGKE